MTITEIKQKGKSEAYHIYIDNQYYGLMQCDVIYKYKLKTGQQINEEFWAEIKKESDNMLCYFMALGHIAKKSCSQKDIKTYLKKHNFCLEAINLAVNKLKDYGYLNDQNYALQLKDSLKQSHGNLYIKQKLAMKGIDEQIIDEILEQNNDKDACLLQAKKWIKAKGQIKDINDKNKLYSSLLRKGFNFDTVKSVVGLLASGVNEDDWN